MHALLASVLFRSDQPSGQEATFLAPLPVTELWGVGQRTAAALTDLGIQTIGDLARFSDEYLAWRFGVRGRWLVFHSRGIDESPIQTTWQVKSISKAKTFSHDVSDKDVLKGALYAWSEVVGRELRRKGLTCRTVRLKLRWPDFSTLKRQATMRDPTDLDEVIYTEVVRLFERYWIPGHPVRLLGVGVRHLSGDAR